MGSDDCLIPASSWIPYWHHASCVGFSTRLGMDALPRRINSNARYYDRPPGSPLTNYAAVPSSMLGSDLN